jgi:putative transposase
VVSSQGRREQCDYVCAHGIPKRRACGLIGMARSTLSYRLRQAAKDAPVIAAMCRLSSQYPRYGYRRIRIFLSREGMPMSPSRAERLWRQAGLQLPRRRPRRRIAASRPRPLPPRAANHVWAYDFVFDACANGQQIKCLTVVDERGGAGKSDRGIGG